MQFTRKQIIAYLKKNHAATIPELSKALNLTVGNIRHHIHDLEGQAVIETVGNLPAKGRGRPTKLYALTKSVQEHNLEGLADTLLKIVFRKPEKHQMCEDIAYEMTSGFQGDPNPVQRLNKAIQWLNEHNYQARWEASPNGPRLIIEHCPYNAIRESHRELCQLDSTLLTYLTGTPMRQVQKRSETFEEPQHCVFVVQAA